MEIIYKAFDGTEFQTQEECEAFEKRWSLLKPQMCKCNGDNTSEFYNAYAIRVTNEDESRWFKFKISNDCRIEMDDKRFITSLEDRKIIGVWCWNSNCSTYQRIDYELVKFIESTKGD